MQEVGVAIISAQVCVGRWADVSISKDNDLPPQLFSNSLGNSDTLPLHGDFSQSRTKRGCVSRSQPVFYCVAIHAFPHSAACINLTLIDDKFKSLQVCVGRWADASISKDNDLPPQLFSGSHGNMVESSDILPQHAW